MRSKLVLLFLFFFSSVVSAQTNLQIYVPGLQYRYEEGSDQNIDVRDYTHYSANIMYERFLIGVEYNIFEDITGNASLSVKSTVKEINAVLGFSVIKFDFANLLPESNLELLAQGYVGNNKTEVQTTLLGNQQTDESTAESVLGAGAAALVRLQYFIVSIDTRWMQSKAYTPNSVSVTTFKLGVNFNF